MITYLVSNINQEAGTCQLEIIRTIDANNQEIKRKVDYPIADCSTFLGECETSRTSQKTQAITMFDNEIANIQAELAKLP